MARGLGINIGVGLDTTVLFNTRAVTQAVDRAKRRVLVAQGAYLRKIAQHQIPDRRGPSRPGNPPHSHTGILRQRLFFAYDRAAESVVVGPQVFNPSDAPGLLEHGGLIPRTGKPLAARPFMGPALERAEPKLASLWHDSVKG